MMNQMLHKFEPTGVHCFVLFERVVQIFDLTGSMRENKTPAHFNRLISLGL